MESVGCCPQSCPCPRHCIPLAPATCHCLNVVSCSHMLPVLCLHPVSTLHCHMPLARYQCMPPAPHSCIPPDPHCCINVATWIWPRRSPCSLDLAQDKFDTPGLQHGQGIQQKGSSQGVILTRFWWETQQIYRQGSWRRPEII